MFKFDFNIEDADDETGQTLTDLPYETEQKPCGEQQPFSEIPISELLDCLPSQISYSPLSVLLANKTTLTLARRDLFDARFQLISESGDEVNAENGTISSNASALEFLEAPSDLVPGVYEGGLKTWECSLDLVSYLDGIGFSSEDLRNKRILEIGCGTAVPSLYLLRRIFSLPPPTDPNTVETQVHLQDYNASVLKLVSFPNILLTWYMSAASASYHEAEHTGTDALEGNPVLDPTSPSEFQITPELKAAFIASLHEHKLSLRFFSGSWETFDVANSGGKYDVVLTSETIYRTESLPSLINLMQIASSSSSASLGSTVDSRKLSPVCLVAAKLIYFGVGGGVSEFVDAVMRPGAPGGEKKGRVETVWESNVGVGRRVILVRWT